MPDDPINSVPQQPITPEPIDEAAATEPADDQAKSQPTSDTSSAAADSPEQAPHAAEAEAATPDVLGGSVKPVADDASGAVDAAGEPPVSPEEVEATMQEMLAAAEQPVADSATGEAGSTAGGAVSDEEVDAATQLAPDASEAEAGLAPPANATPFEAPEFSAEGGEASTSVIDLLDDVQLDVKIELGRAEMYIEDVLGLGVGSVVALDKAAGDPVDIFVNDRLVARGEVLVLNDNFCVRINDILSPIPELERET